MPGTIPLNNVKLQSPLDLNDKDLTATNDAKRFVVKNVGTSKVIDASDMGRQLKLSGSGTLTFNSNLANVAAGDTFTAVSPGSISFVATGVTLYSNNYDITPDNIFQFTYVGSNTWIVLNTN